MRLRVLVGALCLAACGRIDFDPVDSDPVALGCWPQWRSGTATFSASRPVAELNTSGYESDPWLTADELEIYFVAGNDADASTFDIVHATRGDPASPFGTPEVFAISSPGDEDDKLSISADGLTAVFASQRPPSLDTDLWYATRSVATTMFGTPVQAPLAQVNTVRAEQDPHLTGDGLRLYFSPNDDMMVQTIATTSRMTRADPFGPPSTVAGLAGPIELADPSLSPDELVIAYTGLVSSGDTDLFYATRADVTDAFSHNTQIASLNTAMLEGNPFITEDGCRLWFTSAKNGSIDLFVADVAP